MTREPLSDHFGTGGSDAKARRMLKHAAEAAKRDLSPFGMTPAGWDHDLWFAFRAGVGYERTVPRDLDGEPLFDTNGNPRRRS